MKLLNESIALCFYALPQQETIKYVIMFTRLSTVMFWAEQFPHLPVKYGIDLQKIRLL